MPEIKSDFTKVSVTIYSQTLNHDIVSILDYIDNHFELTQKEYITLGIIASHKKMPATQLASHLQLDDYTRTRTWLGTLLSKEILTTYGHKKGTQYVLNPKLFEQAKLNIIPSLKTMEPHVLQALIIEDIKYNPNSRMSEIQNRLKGSNKDDVRRIVYKLVKEDELIAEGSNKFKSYKLAKKK